MTRSSWQAAFDHERELIATRYPVPDIEKRGRRGFEHHLRPGRELGRSALTPATLSLHELEPQR